MLRGLLVAAVLTIVFTGFVGFRYASPGTESFDVEYHVTCEQCSVTFRNENGISSEVPEVKSNWSYKFTGNPGQFVYVSASNNLGKPVKVQIKRGGQDLIDGVSAQKDKEARAGAILEGVK